uniref:Uncharacterized protein n=1 Tax=Glossina austeni TaxID=7395 RepID=A0A1A9VC55_GLOAU
MSSFSIRSILYDGDVEEKRETTGVEEESPASSGSEESCKQMKCVDFDSIRATGPTEGRESLNKNAPASQRLLADGEAALVFCDDDYDGWYWRLVGSGGWCCQCAGAVAVAVAIAGGNKNSLTIIMM